MIVIFLLIIPKEALKEEIIGETNEILEEEAKAIWVKIMTLILLRVIINPIKDSQNSPTEGELLEVEVLIMMEVIND